eukprot:scaffold25547_cov113-Cylindrotheca_fusiformis.AAC.2
MTDRQSASLPYLVEGGAVDCSVSWAHTIGVQGDKSRFENLLCEIHWACHVAWQRPTNCGVSTSYTVSILVATSLCCDARQLDLLILHILGCTTWTMI